jgi:hypothetical protein
MWVCTYCDDINISWVAEKSRFIGLDSEIVIIIKGDLPRWLILDKIQGGIL